MAYIGSFVSDNLNQDIQIIWLANNRVKGDHWELLSKI